MPAGGRRPSRRCPSLRPDGDEDRSVAAVAASTRSRRGRVLRCPAATAAAGREPALAARAGDTGRQRRGPATAAGGDAVAARAGAVLAAGPGTDAAEGDRRAAVAQSAVAAVGHGVGRRQTAATTATGGDRRAGRHRRADRAGARLPGAAVRPALVAVASGRAGDTGTGGPATSGAATSGVHEDPQRRQPERRRPAGTAGVAARRVGRLCRATGATGPDDDGDARPVLLAELVEADPA